LEALEAFRTIMLMQAFLLLSILVRVQHEILVEKLKFDKEVISSVWYRHWLLVSSERERRSRFGDLGVAQPAKSIQVDKYRPQIIAGLAVSSASITTSPDAVSAVAPKTLACQLFSELVGKNTTPTLTKSVTNSCVENT